MLFLRTNEDFYYLLKDLYSVAGLAKCNGQLAEMYVYDTYGQAKIYQWPEGDVNRDGELTNTGTDNDHLTIDPGQCTHRA